MLRRMKCDPRGVPLSAMKLQILLVMKMKAGEKMEKNLVRIENYWAHNLLKSRFLSIKCDECQWNVMLNCSFKCSKIVYLIKQYHYL